MSEFIDVPLDWDDSISNDGKGYTILDEGDYKYTVVGFDRGKFNGSEKLPACNKAILTLEFESAYGPVQITENLLLLQSLEWKISSFFRSIGQKKHGEELKPNWNKVLGSTGMAHIKPRKYVGKNDGLEKTTNSVAYYIDYVPEVMRNVEKKAAPKKKADEFEEDIPF